MGPHSTTKIGVTFWISWILATWCATTPPVPGNTSSRRVSLKDLQRLKRWIPSKQLVMRWLLANMLKFFFVPLFVGEELLARSWKISSWTLKFDVPVPQRKSHASTQPRTYEKVYREACYRTSQCNSTRICAVVQVPIVLFILVFGTNRLKTNLLNKNACAWASIFHGVWQVMLGGGHINADMQQFLENDKKVRPLAPFWRWSGDGLVQFWSYDTNMPFVSCIMVIQLYIDTRIPSL